MLNKTQKHLIAGMIGIFLSCPLSLPAADLNIADVPLAVVSSVSPNVMLLLDNSGSMRTISWYQGDGGAIPAYSPNATYENWCGPICANDNRWTPDQGRIQLNSINNGRPRGNTGTACNPANFDLTNRSIPNPYNTASPYTVGRFLVQGHNNVSGVRKCLVLPDYSLNGSSSFTGHYLNYLFQFFSADADISNIIPFKNRMEVMQDVTRSLVNDTSSMRFGLTTFDNGNGGRVLVGSRPKNLPTEQNNNAAVITGIGNLSAGGNTPLAESLYEITRYFRNMRPGYGSGDDFDDPVEFSCQKNFVITVTDGLPTDDSVFNTNGETSAVAAALPNWDGYGSGQGVVKADTLTHFDDANSFLLDDIAKFAYDLDVKTGPGFDGIQNIQTYTVGFSIDNILLEDTAHYGSGRSSADTMVVPPTNYFTANDEAQLRYQLQNALTNIEGQSGSAASIAASTGFVGAGAALFQGIYDTSTWTGNLRWYEIVTGTGNSISINAANPDATSELTSMITGNVQRNIFSLNTDTNTGISFDWANITTAQQAQLNGRREIVEYVRGDQACETLSSGACTSPRIKNLRDRNRNNEGFLGTIINSTPIYIGRPTTYYPGIWAGQSAPENNTGAQKYSDFKLTHQDRRGMVYVGANDGMLHAFDGGHVGNPYDLTGDPNIDPTMRERFAYVPAAVYPKLPHFADAAQAHEYLVDGTPNIIDAFFGDAGGDQRWHSVLVGGLNNGGQGVYALDVSDPERFGAGNVLWEFTHNNDRDMGYSFSRPAIVRMHNGEWAAVFGNGYNNTLIDEGDTNGDGVIDASDDTGNNDSLTGTAVLYIVNIRTGALIQKIDTGVGPGSDPNRTPNGMSTVTPIDLNGDFIVDYIYGGDLYGNLWRFDVTSNAPGSWSVFGKGNGNQLGPIFSAVGPNGQPQPITARPAATLTSAGGLMLYFGTGQYLQISDISNTNIQTFYGLLDNPVADKRPAANSSVTTRANMTQSLITTETVHGVEGVRQFSNSAPDIFMNWYVDLVSPGLPSPVGERVIGPAIVRGQRSKTIIFTSIVPTDVTCDYGGRSWLIELDARNGNQTSRPVFDLNFDGQLDNLDNSGNEVNNGWAQGGIQSTPAILGGGEIEYKILTGSTGTMRAIGEHKSIRPGERQSWRQLK